MNSGLHLFIQRLRSCEFGAEQELANFLFRARGDNDTYYYTMDAMYRARDAFPPRSHLCTPLKNIFVDLAMIDRNLWTWTDREVLPWRPRTCEEVVSSRDKGKLMNQHTTE